MTTEVPNRCAENLTRRGGDTAPYLTGVFVRREGRARCPHRAVLVSVWNLAFLWSLGFGVSCGVWVWKLELFRLSCPGRSFMLPHQKPPLVCQIRSTPCRPGHV